jgi:hypothetical protein
VDGHSDPAFEVRVVAVNDQVWTGEGAKTVTRFPALSTITVAEDRPTENMCSVALRIRYGRFDYFTGGDMPGYPVPGAPAWHDTETAVARAIGATDAHMVNHHGSIEEENLFWLATLRSRVMVVPAWSLDTGLSRTARHLRHGVPASDQSSHRPTRDASGVRPRPRGHSRRVGRSTLSRVRARRHLAVLSHPVGARSVRK